MYFGFSLCPKTKNTRNTFHLDGKTGCSGGKSTGMALSIGQCSEKKKKKNTWRGTGVVLFSRFYRDYWNITVPFASAC